MKQKLPTVSVIIPVYNEEDRIHDCLFAVTHQTVKPLEIILVDNNSDDQTVAIARHFKGVKIITEKQQGLTMARNKGFNSAKGTVLARIDADTVVSETWVSQVVQAFKNDSKLDGITGYGRTRAGITIPILSDIWSWAYFTHCKAFFGATMLWGANMAIRATAWQKAKGLCCFDDSLIHEDQDLSLALNSIGSKLAIVPNLRVSVDFGDIQYIDKFWHYYRKKHHTRQVHRLHFRSRLITNQYLPAYKRGFYHVIASYTVGLFMGVTALNSARKLIVNTSRQSVLYWWYQKIKSDIEF